MWDCLNLQSTSTVNGVSNGNQTCAHTAARSYHPGGVNISFCDGSVKFIKNTINPTVWLALGSIRGGEVVSADFVLDPASAMVPVPGFIPYPEASDDRRDSRDGPRWSFPSRLVAMGCSQQAPPLTTGQLDEIKLREVGELYRLHQVMAGKAPRSLKDFNAIGDADSPMAYGAIRSGDVVVRWEVTLPDTEIEPTSPSSDEVLAYLKSVPEKGGSVLMVDRRIRRMTPEEFKNAKFAGTAGDTARKVP